MRCDASRGTGRSRSRYASGSRGEGRGKDGVVFLMMKRFRLTRYLVLRGAYVHIAIGR